MEEGQHVRWRIITIVINAHMPYQYFELYGVMNELGEDRLLTAVPAVSAPHISLQHNHCYTNRT